jgi:hypothetical protein
VIFLGDFSFVRIFLKNYRVTMTNYFRYFMFGKYNGFVSKERVSACMYFLVMKCIVICVFGTRVPKTIF